MKLRILFVLFILPFFGFSQTVDTAAVIQQVDSLIQLNRTLVGQRKYDEAMAVIDSASNIALESMGDNHPIYAKCLFNKGRTFDFLNQYTEAEQFYLKAKDIPERIGTEDLDYTYCLNNLAHLYKNMGNYEKAERFYLKTKDIRGRILGKENSSYGKILNNLGVLYLDMGNYEEAEPLLLEAKAIRQRTMGKENSSYGQSLHNLGLLYGRMGNYEKAEPLYLEAIEVRGKVLGKENLDYAWSLHNLGLIYQRMGSYDKAEPMYLEAMAIRKKVLGKENLDYAWSLNNLGNIYLDMGNFEKAEPLLLEAKAVRGKVLGKENPDYAWSLHSLGRLYTRKGDYKKAEPILFETMAIREKVLGENHIDYAESLDAIGYLYFCKGNYQKCESYYLEAKDIKEKALGKESLALSWTLMNLGGFYWAIGNYEKAKLVYLEVKDIREKVLGKYHPEYASSLVGIGGCYMNLGNYQKAEPLFLEAKSIFERVLGTESAQYDNCRSNLAVLYWLMGYFDKAEPLYIETMAMQEKLYGKEHPDYARSLENLAQLYTSMGKLSEAESLYLDAKGTVEKVLGKEHPNYVGNLIGLAAIYRLMGRFDTAEALYQEIMFLEENYLNKASLYLSEQELSTYSKKLIAKGINRYFSFAQSCPKVSSDLSGGCFDIGLFYNGHLLEAVNQLKRVALSDTVSAHQFEMLKSYNRRLADEYTKPIAERNGVEELEEKALTLEKDLVSTVAGFGEALQQVTWQEVQERLKPGEAAVEFTHYKYYTPQEVTDSTEYAALVLRPGDKAPQFVHLFEELEITPLLQKANGWRGINKLYLPGEGKPLYDLIWEPLEGLLEGIKTVYCSPSGLLHRLNLGAIYLNDKETFADQHQLVLMGTTRHLVIPNSARYSGNDAYVVGGVLYDELGDKAIAEANSSISQSRGLDTLSFYQDSTMRGGSWQYLPESAEEALSVKRILQSADMEVKLDMGYMATEERFKHLGVGAPSPRILHIATHGFFYPDPKEETSSHPALGRQDVVFRISDNPMIRSGLILAGALERWTTGKAPGNREDGILTAYEISQMNLSNTELVVLSACETGLGEIEGNEGVYGLQRAFKIAGAKYLIMSLWSVNDKSSKELMTDFYEQWLTNGLTIPQAFRKAQSDMREIYSDSPFRWAGFVLVE
jgi:tetratricopeptide (TPR) repeat protein/CHAT domain-containing protein